MPPQTQQSVSPEKFLNKILEEAVRDRASDIHIEALADSLRVRFRIDGYLQERARRPLAESDPLITRIKAISDLDLASHLPQDGSFQFSVEIEAPHSVSGALPSSGKRSEDPARISRSPSRLADALTSLFGEAQGMPSAEETHGYASNPETRASVLHPAGKHNMRPPGMYAINVRVSVFPTVYGEAVVFRLLNRSDILIPLANLGMVEKDYHAIKELLSVNYGMLLTTGPSGSGKTTTLYAMLQELKNKEKNIITIEDPVEFYFGDIRQTQVRPEQGLTYAIGMRSILRQDPDVLMIGEIRDHETAEHAMRASLVGRIVGSTVHSNTTIGTIARLIDMNVERSLIAYAISGIIAQRLVRKVCESCAAPYAPEPRLLERLGIPADSQNKFQKGRGCDACGGTGYNGRIGVFAVLTMDDNLRSLIVERASMKALQEYIKTSGMVTLRQRAAEKVLAGLTTVEEGVLVV